MLIKEDKDNILLAKIVGIHGIKGLVKIKIFTEDTEIFRQDNKFYNQYNDDMMIKISFVKENLIIANINNINDRNIAEQLVGQEIYIARNHLPLEKDDEIYFVDLINMDVISVSTQEKIGIITNVHNFGAGDIIEYMDNNDKQQMISFNDKFINHVDKKYRKVFVNIFKEF